MVQKQSCNRKTYGILRPSRNAAGKKLNSICPIFCNLGWPNYCTLKIEVRTLGYKKNSCRTSLIYLNSW